MYKFFTILLFAITTNAIHMETNDGHLSYFMSMPSAMGIQSYFPIEWWYFAGVLNVGNTMISIMIANIKYRNIATMNSYGIGIGDQFYNGITLAGGINNPFNSGLIVAVPTITSENISFNTPYTKFKFIMTNGSMGDNATYQLKFTNDKFNISMNLNDNYGCIFEGNKGYIANDSVEFGFPRLNVTNGTFITNQTVSNITSGNIWYDRQMLLNKINPNPLNFQLYNGVWFYIITQNISLQMAFIYNQRPNDINWIIGNKSDNYPVLRMGLDFTDQNVITFTDYTNYDINIFNYTNPQSSPHWTSPKSSITYGMKWTISYDTRQFIVVANYNSEIDSFVGYAFEGSTTVYDEANNLIGYGFMEQMLG